MVNSNREIDQLSHLYSEGLQLAEELQTLLKAEEAALRSRDTALIQSCTEKKSKLLNEFEKTESARQQLYQTHKDQLNDTVSNKHHQFQKRMADIQQQNLINASIIKLSEDFTQQILDIVRGINASQSTYDALGTTIKPRGNQSLAKV